MKINHTNVISHYHSEISKYNAVSADEVTLWCDTKTLTKHHFYIDLILYFSPLFPSINIENLERFSVICLSFLRGLIGFDRLLDDIQQSKFKLGLINYELAIKLTSNIFPTQHLFWSDFNEIQACFFNAIKNENNKNIGDEFNQEDFELLSQHKSAYVKVAVNLLSHFDNYHKYNQQLNDSLMSLHIAMQYIDDIKDFKHDLENQQTTYIITQTYSFLSEIGIDSAKVDFDKLYKYMLISGLAEKHCQLAIDHLNKAIGLVNILPIPKYKNFLFEERRQTEKMLWMIEDIIERNSLHVEYLNTKKQIHNKNIITIATHAKKMAVDYVFSKVDSTNYWQSFLTDNGKGKLWVTAFISCQLLDSEVSNQKFNTILDFLETIEPEHFAYNEKTPKDSDSSTFFIHFHQLSNRVLSKEKLASWLDFSDKNGHWHTYHSNDIIPILNSQKLNCNGWASKHNCVAAAAAFVLVSHFNESLYKKTIAQLLLSQEQQGFWRSYWWSSDIYATSFAIQALSKLKNKDKQVLLSIEKACSWLVSQQCTSGKWQDPFYTALAIKALFTQKEKFNHEINSGIQWLLTNQLVDGSWLTSNVLRIPHPHDLKPHKHPDWGRSPYGFNTLAYDNQRTFSTSLIINALTEFISQREK